MAKAAMARETFFALRQEIARIEGTLPERPPSEDDDDVAAEDDEVAGVVARTSADPGLERGE